MVRAQYLWWRKGLRALLTGPRVATRAWTHKHLISNLNHWGTTALYPSLSILKCLYVCIIKKYHLNDSNPDQIDEWMSKWMKECSNHIVQHFRLVEACIITMIVPVLISCLQFTLWSYQILFCTLQQYNVFIHNSIMNHSEYQGSLLSLREPLVNLPCDCDVYC